MHYGAYFLTEQETNVIYANKLLFTLSPIYTYKRMAQRQFETAKSWKLPNQKAKKDYEGCQKEDYEM